MDTYLYPLDTHFCDFVFNRKMVCPNSFQCPNWKFIFNKIVLYSLHVCFNCVSGN